MKTLAISKTITPDKPCASFNEWVKYIRKESIKMYLHGLVESRSHLKKMETAHES